MAWYYLRTGLNAKDMFGEVAYVEFEDAGLSKEEAHERVKDVHPGFHSGTYVKGFSEFDWDVDSLSFDDEDEFLTALGDFVESSTSNAAYSLSFGRVSTNEARKKAD